VVTSGNPLPGDPPDEGICRPLERGMSDPQGRESVSRKPLVRGSGAFEKGRQMSKMKRRILFAGGTATVVLGIAVGAYAYWTQSGSGTGSATADTTSSITVNQTSSVSALYPGGTAVTLSGNFNNPNSSAVKISS